VDSAAFCEEKSGIKKLLREALARAALAGERFRHNTATRHVRLMAMT